METEQIVYAPAPAELSLGQRQHWEQVLEDAERLRETALRYLGRLPLEQETE